MKTPTPKFNLGNEVIMLRGGQWDKTAGGYTGFLECHEGPIGAIHINESGVYYDGQQQWSPETIPEKHVFKNRATAERYAKRVWNADLERQKK